MGRRVRVFLPHDGTISLTHPAGDNWPPMDAGGGALVTVSITPLRRLRATVRWADGSEAIGEADGFSPPVRAPGFWLALEDAGKGLLRVSIEQPPAVS
jgi:hypothetical protein